MRLYKRGDVWHYDFTANGQRYRGTTGEALKVRAAAEADRLRRAALGQTSAPVPTLGEVAAKWFASKADGKKSVKTTALRLEIALRLLGPETPIDQIDTPQMEDAIQRRRLEPTRQSLQARRKRPDAPLRTPSNSTVNRDLIDTTMRPIIRYAKKTLKLGVHDIEWADLKRAEPKDRDRPFTPDEISDWRRNLPPWYRQLHDFYGRYGLRLAEAFFPPSAVDIPNARIAVRERKNGKTHTIRLLPGDAAWMAARVGRAVAAGLDRVWYRERADGSLRGLKPRGYQSASRLALDRAKIADARPTHDLRHHAATTMVRATGNLGTVKKLLGHENIASTLRYAHADDDDVLSALRHTYGTEARDEPEKPKAVNGQGRKRSGT